MKIKDRAHREWTEEQIQRLAEIVRSYRGEKGAKKYKDVKGLCKAATLDEVRTAGYSLNPGRYVGTADGEFVSDADKVKVEIFLRDENVWLTQAKIAELFNVGIPAINKHLKNIFDEGELQENSVISKMEITADDGKNYKTMFYNLDAILSVSGYPQ